MNQLSLGTPGQDRVYVPSFLADRELVGEAVRLKASLGSYTVAGQIPGVVSGGVIELAGQEWGIDHVAGFARSNEGRDELVILGTDKSAVQVDEDNPDVGKVDEEGLVVLTNKLEDRLVIAGLIEQYDGWNVDRFRRMGLSARRFGDFVIGIPGLGAKIPLNFRIHAANESEAIARPISR